jgi:cold shock CspA family protein
MFTAARHSSARFTNRASFLAQRIWFSTEGGDDGFLTGTVKFYDKRKAWGIVVGDDSEKQEFFIHRRSIVSWLPTEEDLNHPFLKENEKVRFKGQKKEGSDYRAMKALELTFIDGSQVPAYRSDYIKGNKKRLAHTMGERVYAIMESTTLTEEQKMAEVVNVYQKTSEVVNSHKMLLERQNKAMGIVPPEAKPSDAAASEVEMEKIDMVTP